MPRLSPNRLTMEDGRIDRAALKDWSETALGVSANIFSGTSYTVNIENGTVCNVILNANCVFSFSNPTGSGNACSFTLVLKQDNIGGRSVTFPTIYWSGGVQPTLASASGDFDVIEFSTVDGGAKWNGSVVQRNVRGAELWGWGNSAKAGLNVNVGVSSPTQVGSLTDWAMITGGNAHGAAIKTDGTHWTWGTGTNGRLGRNSVTNTSSPAQVGTLTNWARVSAAIAHTTAIKTDRTLWVWGFGSNGIHGLNIADTVERSSPTQVGTLTNWLYIDHRHHAAAIKTDGTLWSWGVNDSGGLGHNDVISRSSPVQVGTLADWSTVVVGGETGGLGWTAAIKTDGTLWAWGNGGSGRLGFNSTTSRSSPVQVGTDTDWAVVAPGNTSTLAIKTNGTLWTWGLNDDGELASNNRLARSSPAQVGTLTDWIAIFSYRGATGRGQVQALKNDNTLWVWAGASDGELGLNNNAYRSSPVQVGTLANWRAIGFADDAGGALQYP